MTIGTTYAAYKEATRKVTNWILSATIVVLDRLTEVRHEAAGTHADLLQTLRVHVASSTVPSIRSIDTMLTLLADLQDASGDPVFHQQKCRSFFDDLPNVLSSCVHAVELRTISHRRYERSTDPNVAKSNERHRHFVRVMNVWFTKLERLWKRANSSTGKRSQNRNLDLSFSILNIEEVDDFDPAAREEDVGDRRPEVDATCTDVAIYGMEIAEENTDDFDDIIFVLQCFMVDLDGVMKIAADAWLEVRNGESNFVSASLASLLAFRQVKELTAELEKEFPTIKSFQDLQAALLQPKLTDPNTANNSTTDEDPELTARLDRYASTREYPVGSLYRVMHRLEYFVGSFSSGIPRHVAQMRPYRELFGTPFDEMLYPVNEAFDFGRFLMEVLPLLFNEYQDLRDFFKDHDLKGDWPRFVLFKEVFDELAQYFERSRDPDFKSLPIPFMFLISMWYHSVQVLQGGMLLSRITALTRNALSTFAQSLEKCVAEHDGTARGDYFTIAARKFKHLEERTSFYRNNPFMAGAIALDISVNLAPYAGVVHTGSSMMTHVVLHIYNTAVRGGVGVPPSAVVEKFLAVYSGAFFAPARPSHNFLRSMQRTGPGMDPEEVSELYQVLVLGNDTLLTPGREPDRSLAGRVSKLRKMWDREFYESNTVAFNCVEFAFALKSLGLDLLKLVPECECWEEGLIFFVVLFDQKKTKHAVYNRAVACMRAHLARLSATPEALDLLPRVRDSMHAALYGPLAVLVPHPGDDQDYHAFSHTMSVFEKRGAGPLTGDEITAIYAACRDHPATLGMHDAMNGGKHKLTTGIVNHAAGGPRANTELLERLLQLGALALAGPVGAVHACAVAGNVANLELVLAAHNYTEREQQCLVAENTPLHYAAQFGREAVVEYLDGLMVDPSVVNAGGKSALDLARSSNVRNKIAAMLAAHRSQGDLRIKSKSAGSKTDNVARWAAQAGLQRQHVFRKLDERREMNKREQTITADDEARAERAAGALLEEEAREKEQSRGRGRKYTNGRKGKQGTVAGKSKRR